MPAPAFCSLSHQYPIHKHKQSSYNPDKHHRQSIRLKGYDYAQPGFYFITMCTHYRKRLFGEIMNGVMVLNELGNITHQYWQEIPNHFPHATLDEFIVMPNHVHGIIVIHGVAGDGGNRVMVETINDDDDRMMVETAGANNHSPLHPPPYVHPTNPHTHPTESSQPRGTSKTIGSIVRGFKIGVTKWAHQNTSIHTVWQRNYHDRIIRDQQALQRIRQYIIHNPAKWESDGLG